jgi:hypothetical protein
VLVAHEATQFVELLGSATGAGDVAGGDGVERTAGPHFLRQLAELALGERGGVLDDVALIALDPVGLSVDAHDGGQGWCSPRGGRDCVGAGAAVGALVVKGPAYHIVARDVVPTVC